MGSVKTMRSLTRRSLGERTAAARDRDAGPFESGRKRIQRRRIRHFPAEECRAAIGVGIHDDALLAVIHAQREHAARLVDELHAEKTRRVGRPVFQIPGADADIAEPFDHGSSRAFAHGDTITG